MASVRNSATNFDEQLVIDNNPQPVTTVKVQQFLTSFGFGGTERQVEHLVRNMDRNRFAVRFACLKKWGHFLQNFEQQKIPIDEYPISSFYQPSTLSQQWRFAADMRRHHIQICHSYNFYANTFALTAAKLARTPLIIASIRDTGMNITPAKMLVHKWACNFADCILVNAYAVRQWLVQQGYREDKISVIHNGIDLDRFKKSHRFGSLRRELGIPEHAKLVVVLARLAPEKGIEYFLNAAAAISPGCSNAYFLIVGDRFAGTGANGVVKADLVYRHALRHLAEQLGIADRVLFTGYRADVPSLLAQANVSVLPSVSGEGLSNTLLESMAAGTPVVATKVGGNAEIVERDGVEGILVPPRDTAALAQAIEAILNDSDLAGRLAGEALVQVRTRFSLDRMIRETENLYLRKLEFALSARSRSHR